MKKELLSLAFLSLTAFAVVGCGSSSPAVDAAPTSDSSVKTPDAGRTFPAVCQKIALSCPDQASLDKCEADNGQAFSLCAQLPIITGCKTNGCPSRAQICRTAELAEGYCTHSCVRDTDCPLGNGSNGVCTTISGVVKICTRS
jgi:hypothetical protein